MQPAVDVVWQLTPARAWPEVAALWDSVNALAGGLPCHHSAFIAALLSEFGHGNEVVAIARRGDAPVAAALLCRPGISQTTTFQPSQLPVGPWLVANTEDAGALAQSLLQHLPGLCLSLGLTQLDPLLRPRPQDDPLRETLDYIETGWIDVDGRFDDYWAARGKNLRTNMRKQRSKLESDGVAVAFDTLTDPSAVPQAIAEYGRMEAAGWKDALGTSVQPGNAQGRFYTAMLQNFCARGKGRIWRLKFGDRVVAMDLCIESERTLIVLKTAFDPEFRNVSPAFLMRQEAFRQVFDEGRLRRIEFYGRMMEWHTRWTEQSRTLYHANVFRWALVKRLHHRLRAVRGRVASQAAPDASAALTP